MRIALLAKLSIATFVALLFIAPVQAQQGGYRTSSSPPPAAQKQTNTRDHRTATSRGSQGGTTVTTSNRQRSKGSECVRSVIGGPCVGGAAVKAAKAANKYEPISTGAQGVYDSYKTSTRPKTNQVRDHRKKK
jgi:hypothetical protein